MKMNTLYMAVAATAFGLSSNAMAALNFTDGNLTGSVDIGGDIVVPHATNFWQWATSDAIVLDKDVTTLTNNYKTMTIPVASNLPLLVGQTTAATVGNAGSTALNPQITLTNADNAPVNLTWDTTGATGKGTLTLLPVTNTDGTVPLGTMSIRVKVGAVRATLFNGQMYVQSVSKIASGTGLFGGVALPAAPAGALAIGSIAADWNRLLGAKSAADLRVQINTASGLNFAGYQNDNQSQAYAFDTPSDYYSGTYGLGIAQGDNITVSFTNPVTSTTAWKTTLKATISYL